MMGRLLNHFAGRRGLSIIVSLVLLCCQIDAFSSPQSIANRHAAAAFSTISPRGHVFYQPAGPIRKRISISAHDMGREESDISSRGKPWIQRGVKGCKKAVSKMSIFMHKILLWQRKNRRSALAAAAFALSVLACSKDQISQYVNYETPSSQSEINIMQPRQTLMARGGSSSPTARSSGGTSIFKNSNKGTPEKILEDATRTTGKAMQNALTSLGDYMKGSKADALILLLATALVTPFSQNIGISPILGFLSAGMLLGPNGFGLIKGIHSTEVLAELGIVFFLFEMGIELSVERLLQMRKDVFGLGLSQYLLTALAIAGFGSLFGLPANALVVLGGGLALSSSAFVLQLLKDKNELATRYGKASFGVLLFQDLAVVPLLVVTPILAGGGAGLASAVGSAVLKASMALGSIAVVGRFILNPLFKIVASAKSQEAFLGVILLTVLSMSFMTEGLGLSNTLGAFLAGVLLSETKYRYQIEADIAPFRGILLGLFFVTVGFEIDVHLIATNLPTVASIVVGILAIKSAVLTSVCLAFGLSLSTSQQTGLILSQGGEFAFVAFGLARSLGILDGQTTKLLLTCVSLTMALTPLMDLVGHRIAKRLEEDSDFTHYLGEDRDANEIKGSDDFVVVAGYGAVGKVVCDMLDQKLIKYVGLDNDPNKAIQARNKGLPVFYGDIGRPEVAEAFGVGKAKAVIVCIADQSQCSRAVIALRRLYPNMKIFARAANADHAERLQKTLDVIAMVPVLPEDNLLLTLPFGGAVLKSLGAAPEEVNAILETKRKELLSGRGLRDNEEQASLYQLGVIAEVEDEEQVVIVEVEPTGRDEKNAAASETGEAGEARKTEEASSSKERKKKEKTPTEAAAAAKLEQTKEKSPMVAEFIEANCPGSVDDKKKEKDTELEVEIGEVSKIANVTKISSSSNATRPPAQPSVVED